MLNFANKGRKLATTRWLRQSTYLTFFTPIITVHLFEDLAPLIFGRKLGFKVVPLAGLPVLLNYCLFHNQGFGAVHFWGGSGFKYFFPGSEGRSF